MTPDRIDQALAHVKQGFAAMSVWSTKPDGTCKCVKGKDCTSPGKHPIPKDGFQAASTDPTTVYTMLSAGSEPNYGIVWPEGSDRVLLILDVDGATWKQRIAELKADLGPLPATKTTRTPSGGLHLFYWWPKDVPVPEGNTLLGFVVRWPWKGYVVGPGSAINGKTYTDAGIAEIAELPVAWALTTRLPAAKEPLITVAGSSPGYTLPESVPTGHRHDEITRFVASLWNRNITRDAIIGLVDLQLRPLFVEPASDEKVLHDIDEAMRTADRKWTRPEAINIDQPEAPPATVGEIVIDPLAIESRIDRPEPLDPHALPLPTGLALLLEHYRPLTDAPWSSLLLASAVTMSALAGPSPSLQWRGSHRAALFGALVGHTNWGRKGATMRVVDQAFRQVDPLLDEITMSGVASGEVLIDILNESKKTSLGTALISQHEIAGMLIVASREGSILSTILRQAWDGDKVESRSRAKGTSSAFGYTVAFMGGVTPGELSTRLTATEIANGWANRFLWFFSERRDAEIRNMADDTLDPATISYLRDCITFARALGGSSMLIKPRFTMHLAPEADQRLTALAKRLDVRPIGALGSLQQRMPGHVIRLAMVAALFDQSAEVGVDHVEFGEAMASYAVASMRAVFGVRIDDPVAMLVLEVLGQSPDGWMNTTNLRQAVGGKDHSRLMTALRVLMAEGLVVREDRPSGGRPAVGYRLRTAS